MPENYVGTNVFPTPLVLPLNGERAEANVSADGAWKDLADRTIYNQDQQLQSLLTRRPQTCDMMIVGGQARVVRLNQAYVKDVTTGNIVALTPTLPFVYNPPGGYLGGAIYYFYMFVDNGTVGMEITDVVPGANNVFKTGTETHKYLGAAIFATPLFAETTVSNQSTVCAPYVIGIVTNGTMPVAYPLEVPVTVTSLRCRFSFLNTGAMGAPMANWRATGATSTFSYPVVPGLTQGEFYTDVVCSTGQQLDLWVSDGLVFFYPICYGWVE